MALSNRDRIGKAFELLAFGLEPFVDGEMRAASPAKANWLPAVAAAQPNPSMKASLSDPHFQLKLVWDYWHPIFGKVLGQAERTLVSELRLARNKWAHNDAFNTDDCYRTLDSIQRLLTAVSAPQAAEIARSKAEFLRQSFDAEARRAAPQAQSIASSPTAGLKPWREVVVPHADVASGRFQQAEFAADLAQVHRGEGVAEYVEPVEFFRRTYLTEGLRQLLTQATQRITGTGGVPVVDLQTNFGGGKTHSLLALYHLLSGVELEALPQELQDLTRAAGVATMPAVRRAVLVGTSLQPGQPQVKPDGTEVRTLWGELAWQLGGRDGFDLVAAADRTATNPGDALRELFEYTSPCLVLVDEWVAYARQLYSRDDLPAGNFDTHFSFAQALTEAARAVPGVLLVISIPASDPGTDPERVEGVEVEVGGVGGREALRRLRNVIGRMESSWRPASAEESFEIVRRRLFDPMTERARFADRDATARAFGDFYRAQSREFPVESREPAYMERIKAAYPIHPELFARLYEDWSTLDRFQRTRGVLRLMAAVIHALWARNDQAALILPASLPLDDATVLSELTRHLDDNWKPIIDADVDGPGSTPVQLDLELPAFGRVLAGRRVARTVFLGSAPTAKSGHRGIEDQRVRLGCVLPGETTAVFGDALRRLTDRATYLYVEGARYWFGIQPSVTRVAQDRAERLRTRPDEVHAELVARLRADRERGDFSGVHVAPAMSAEVPDEPEARLVVLGPGTPHIARSESSPALNAAVEILERRGTAPRVFRNMVVFLASDQRRLEELEQAIREFLAWRSIEDEASMLNLDAHQANQARTKRAQSDNAVILRIGETYQWLLVPEQPEATGPITWQAIRADSQGALADRASRKLVNDGHLQTSFPPVLLRMQLDGVLATLWETGHVPVATVWNCFARYLYLPRLRDIDVLLGAVRQGPASTTWQSEGFATADALEEATGRYLGLVAGALPAVGVTGKTLLVHPSGALDQLESEPARNAEAADDGPGLPLRPTPSADQAPLLSPADRRLRRFHGAITLDPERMSRDFGKVAQEVIQHLSGLMGADVEVILEVRATAGDGFPDAVVRTVSENAETLKFTSHGFEEI